MLKKKKKKTDEKAKFLRGVNRTNHELCFRVFARSIFFVFPLPLPGAKSHSHLLFLNETETLSLSSKLTPQLE